MRVLLSIGYALFVIFFPWDEVSKDGFSDFESYVTDYNFYSSRDVSAIEHWQISTATEYVIREPLWYELVRWLTGVTGEASIALRIISFFILFVWSYFLLRHVSFGVALLFLFNPTAIDVAMSGIRNGLAWALVVVGLSIRSNPIRAGLFVVGSLIHSSTLVLLFLYYFTEWVAKVLRGRALLFSGLGAAVCVGLALTVGGELLLGALGDRRTGDEYFRAGSFLQASLWATLLYLQCTSDRNYIRQNIFVIAVLAWYLTMNPYIPWSFRIWGAFLPVIAVSAMDLPARKRQIFLCLYTGYLLLQYLYWTKLFEYWYPG